LMISPIRISMNGIPEVELDQLYIQNKSRIAVRTSKMQYFIIHPDRENSSQSHIRQTTQVINVNNSNFCSIRGMKKL
jgi:hypothetical protein